MSDVALALILLGLSAYLLFGGADFGAGVWHLTARGAEDRKVIEHAMAPVWEANHVWLIFVMVMTWSAFPPVFADVMGSHWVPLSLAVLGIVIRGSAFVFHKAVPDGAYGWAFGVSSLLTPFCFGAVAGAVATGERWLGPVGIYAGVLTCALCAYLAAVYLTWDARRIAPSATADLFRRRALATGAVVGALALPGAVGLGVRSPLLFLSAAAGLVSLALLVARRYVAVRASAALAVGSVLWGAASLADLDLDGAAASDASLTVVYGALGVGALFLVPSLVWLYVLFQRAEPPASEPVTESGENLRLRPHN
ncbi:cytochrome d ubiquinol oxidase subunit II [Actinocorallia longicatena]|uniref:Cytochrome d ubiquinol oxidase subunit II n=1 Tax=Actinocorallia longicatena TaxID=111803 RepID=A0ABP6QHZ7_9ACTN